MVIHLFMADEALIRRQRLRSLKFTPTQLAERLGKKPSYFSDLMNLDGAKSFGEKAARSIEQGLELPPFWLDGPRADAEMQSGMRLALAGTSEIGPDGPQADERGAFVIREGRKLYQTEPAPDLEAALTAVRQYLLTVAGEASTRAGDALRLLALTPDSDRAFKNALVAMIPTPGEELPRTQVSPPEVAHPTSQSQAETSPASPQVLGGDSERGKGTWKQTRIPGGSERTDAPETYRSPRRPGAKRRAK